jgi:acyl carrier protein
MNSDAVSSRLHAFILSEFLAGDNPESLRTSTRLVTTGVLTSLAMVRLVAFIEHDFSVKLRPEEMTAEHLDTIELMTALVVRRREQE